MFWTVLIGYVLVSQVFVCSALIGSYLFCPASEESSAIQRLVEQRQWLGLLLGGVGTLVLAPVLCPLMIRCMFIKTDEEKYWTSIQRSYQEISLDPVHELNMDEELLAFIDENSEGLLSVGYESLGDCWIKSFEPFNSKGRFFLSPDGYTVAEIARTMNTLYFEFTSFLDDGSVISSAKVNSIKPFQKMAAYDFFIDGSQDAEIEELIASHQKFVQEKSVNKEQAVRVMTADSWRSYIKYSCERMAVISVELGDKDEGPESCVFPEPNMSGMSEKEDCVPSRVTVAHRS